MLHWKLKNRVAFAALCSMVVSISEPVFAGKDNDTFNVALEAEIETLDVYFGASRNSIIMSHHLFDTLVYKDQETGEFVPALAESFQYIDDTTLEFRLRKGVKYHDGSSFDADDVVYTFEMVSKPNFGAVYQIAVEWIESVEKIDDHTIRLHSKSPNPVALEWLSVALPVYPAGYYEEMGKEGRATQPIGTGPYRLASITPGVRWRLERFEGHYEGSPKGNEIGTIDIRVLPEMNTQVTEILSGNVDFIWKFTPDIAGRLNQSEEVDVKNTPIMRIVFGNLNTLDESPLQDRRVRQAMLHALNRDAILDAFVGGASKVIHTPCNPVQFGCDTDVTTYEYDPDRAEDLLAEAGYPDGFTIPVLAVKSGSTPRTIVEAITADWARVGITSEVDINQYAAIREKWIAGDIPVTIGSWGSWGIGDVLLMNSEFFGGKAVDKVRDEEIMGWLEKADTSVDRDLRKELYSGAIEKVAEEALFFPLWTYNVNYATSKDVEFELTEDEIARFFNARWK